MEKEKKEVNRRKRYQLDLRLFHVGLFLFWGGSFSKGNLIFAIRLYKS